MKNTDNPYNPLGAESAEPCAWLGGQFVTYCRGHASDPRPELFASFLTSRGGQVLVRVIYRCEAGDDVYYSECQQAAHMYWRIEYGGGSYLLPRPVSAERFDETKGVTGQKPLAGGPLRPNTLVWCLPAVLTQRGEDWSVNTFGELSEEAPRHFAGLGQPTAEQDQTKADAGKEPPPPEPGVEGGARQPSEFPAGLTQAYVSFCHEVAAGRSVAFPDAFRNWIRTELRVDIQAYEMTFGESAPLAAGYWPIHVFPNSNTMAWLSLMHPEAKEGLLFPAIRNDDSFAVLSPAFCDAQEKPRTLLWLAPAEARKNDQGHWEVVTCGCLVGLLEIARCFAGFRSEGVRPPVNLNDFFAWLSNWIAQDPTLAQRLKGHEPQVIPMAPHPSAWPWELPSPDGNEGSASVTQVNADNASYWLVRFPNFEFAALLPAFSSQDELLGDQGWIFDQVITAKALLAEIEVLPSLVRICNTENQLIATVLRKGRCPATESSATAPFPKNDALQEVDAIARVGKIYVIFCKAASRMLNYENQRVQLRKNICLIFPNADVQGVVLKLDHEPWFKQKVKEPPNCWLITLNKNKSDGMLVPVFQLGKNAFAKNSLNTFDLTGDLRYRIPSNVKQAVPGLVSKHAHEESTFKLKKRGLISF